MQNIFEYLQPYEFGQKNKKKKDLFDTDEGSGWSSYEKGGENTNTNKQAGTNNWCLCQSCHVEDQEIAALDDNKFEGQSL